MGYRSPNDRTFSLVRRPLECTRDVLKCFEVVKVLGELIPDAWEAAARSNLNAICKTLSKFVISGHTHPLSTWPEIALLLSLRELPQEILAEVFPQGSLIFGAKRNNIEMLLLKLPGILV